MKSKKIISTILASAMAVSLIPGFVFADETEETEVPEILIEEETPEETEPEETLVSEEEILEEEVIEEEPEEVEEEQAEEIIVEEADEEEVDALSGTCGENATWTYDEETKTLTISGEGEMYGYLNAARPWDDFFTEIETLVIEEGITNVGEFAFWRCEQLLSITLPDTLLTIDDGAFSGCESLVSITIPDSVTTINGFNDCTSLEEVVFGENSELETIGGGAFSNCESLTTFTVPSSVTSIGYYAFYSCTSLQDIYCYADPGSLSWEDNDIESYMPDKGTNVHVYSDDLGDYDAIFSGINVTFAGDLEYCGDPACGDDAVYSFDPATGTLTISGTGEMYDFSSDTVPWNLFKDDIETLIVEEGITHIGGNSFSGCRELTSISLPDGLTSIGGFAFWGCKSLTEIELPDTLISIGYLAFGMCEGLTDVYCYIDPEDLIFEVVDGSDTFLADSTTKLHVCYGYADIFASKFPGLDVTYVEDRYQNPCGDTCGWTFDEDTQTLTIFGTGEMYDYDQRNNKAPWFASCTIKNVVIEEGITNVGECAFADCRTLEYVTLPEGITSIEYLAFTGCYKLNSFELPTTLETIGDCAFQNCIGFTWVTIPESVTDINDSFFGCSNVTELYCYADPDELTWYDMTSNDFDRYNRINCHVPYEYLGKYQSKFAGVNVKFVVIPGWITQDGEKYYLQEDGSFYTGWLDFGDGVYYFFDEDGVMQTGWVQDKNYTYYMDEDGVMVTGWQKVDGKYYYFRESGPMKTGWLKDGGKFYYLDLSTGEMAKGWKKISEKWYYFNGGGDMVTGWKKISGKYYYFNDSGDMLTGWLSDGGKYYYLDPSTGAMATGWCKISDKWYYFNGGGDMVTGWKNISGKYYFFKASGAMKTGWFQDGDKKYYLDPSTGEMVTGWKKVSGKWYYFNAGGDMAKGWKKIGNKWYFFKDSGAMQTTNLTYKGKVYYFNSDGSCKNP